MLIPPDYQYSYAMETMLEFVRNRKASTWKECVDLYEEHLLSFRVQKNSAEKQQTAKQDNTELFIKTVGTTFRILWGLTSGFQGMVNSAGSGMFEGSRDSGIRYFDRESGNLYNEDGNRVPW